MFLSPDEIQLLTGKKFRSAQSEALRFMGIEHKVRPDGSIAVLKLHVEKVFGGIPEPKSEKKVILDWSVINA